MMRYQWLLNLALLGIIIILVAIVLWTPKEEKPPEKRPLTAMNSEQVQHIRIERAHEATVELIKESNGWYLTTPVHLPANEFRISNLLKILSMSQYRVLESTQLADFKLDAPLAQVYFNELKIVFGDKSPLDDGQRYILIGDKIYLVVDSVYHFLTGEPLMFASLSPLGESPKIVELQLPDYHLQLQEGTWHLLTAPVNRPNASTDMLNKLVDDWQQVQALRVQQYNPVPAQGEISITLSGQTTPLRFAISSLTPDFILALPEKEVQYQLPRNQVDKLLRLPTKLSDEMGNVSTTGG